MADSPRPQACAAPFVLRVRDVGEVKPGPYPQTGEKVVSVIKNLLIAVVMLLVSSAAFGRCDSQSASYTGGWRPEDSAPRNGTKVEYVQTYGIAPTYGLMWWDNGSWMTGKNTGTGAECLYWRPYKKTAAKYVDPTKGAQNTTAYWCAAAHREYDKTQDRCK